MPPGARDGARAAAAGAGHIYVCAQSWRRCPERVVHNVAAYRRGARCFRLRRADAAIDSAAGAGRPAAKGLTRSGKVWAVQAREQSDVRCSAARWAAVGCPPARRGARPRPINRPRTAAAAVYVVWRAACRAYHVLRVRVRADGAPRAVGGVVVGTGAGVLAVCGDGGRERERAREGGRVRVMGGRGWEMGCGGGRLCERYGREMEYMSLLTAGARALAGRPRGIGALACVCCVEG
eukprot:scaffold24138_cov63-Phaeocystis_antarctica.AAC.2